MSTRDLLSTLEHKVEQALEVIELLRLQLDELEEENAILKDDRNMLRAEQEQWRGDLSALIARFDAANISAQHSSTEESVSEDRLTPEFADTSSVD